MKAVAIILAISALLGCAREPRLSDGQMLTVDRIMTDRMTK